MAAETHSKCVELFRDMLPSARRVAVIANAADPVFAKSFLEQAHLAGSGTGTELVALREIGDSPVWITEPSTLPALAPLKKTTQTSTAWSLIVSSVGPVLRGSIVAIVVLTLFVVLDRQFDRLGRKAAPVVTAAPTIQKQETPANGSRSGPRPVATSSGLPLPGVYGVYAISNGQIYELDALAGGCPTRGCSCRRRSRRRAVPAFPMGGSQAPKCSCSAGEFRLRVSPRPLRAGTQGAGLRFSSWRARSPTPRSASNGSRRQNGAFYWNAASRERRLRKTPRLSVASD
jgi:hypothetical protein